MLGVVILVKGSPKIYWINNSLLPEMYFSQGRAPYPLQRWQKEKRMNIGFIPNKIESNRVGKQHQILASEHHLVSTGMNPALHPPQRVLLGPAHFGQRGNLGLSPSKLKGPFYGKQSLSEVIVRTGLNVGSS